jgi:peptide/nickel transport system permease protein
MSESVSDSPAAGPPGAGAAEVPAPDLFEGAPVATVAGPAVAMPVAGAPPGLGAGAAAAGRKRGDFLYYGLRNKKLILGLTVETLLVLLAIIGPFIAKYPATQLNGQSYAHPGAKYWLGTDDLGRDIFSQLVNGLRESYLIGALGASCAAVVGMLLGFIAGWRGGVIDELIQLLTNILVMVPQLVLLIVISSYLTHPSVFFEGVFIGLTTWPWVARAVRAQTFSLRSREFVDMAKLSGKRPISIIVKEIAPNMASYLFLVIILLFGSSMLLAASFDFLGVGPTNVVSLGSMMFDAQQQAALLYHLWWWFVPPGAVLTGMVAALLVANVGLDEVFNPKLREQ